VKKISVENRMGEDVYTNMFKYLVNAIDIGDVNYDDLEESKGSYIAGHPTSDTCAFAQ